MAITFAGGILARIKSDPKLMYETSEQGQMDGLSGNQIRYSALAGLGGVASI